MSAHSASTLFNLDPLENFYHPLTDSEITLDSFDSSSTTCSPKTLPYRPLNSSTPNAGYSSSPHQRLNQTRKRMSSSASFNSSNTDQLPSESSSPLGPTCSNLTCASPLLTNPPKSNLRLLNINCRGIRGKKSEFAHLLDYTKPDIVCGVESFLHGVKPGLNPDSDHIKSSEIFPPQYNVYRNDRNVNGGGVFILVHKRLVSMELPEFITDCELNWVKLQLLGCKELFIGCFYMPHRSMSDLIALDLSLENINKKGNRHVILCGDFNCPDIDWK